MGREISRTTFIRIFLARQPYMKFLAVSFFLFLFGGGRVKTMKCEVGVFMYHRYAAGNMESPWHSYCCTIHIIRASQPRNIPCTTVQQQYYACLPLVNLGSVIFFIVVRAATQECSSSGMDLFITYLHIHARVSSCIIHKYQLIIWQLLLMDVRAYYMYDIRADCLLFCSHALPPS